MREYRASLFSCPIAEAPPRALSGLFAGPAQNTADEMCAVVRFIVAQHLAGKSVIGQRANIARDDAIGSRLAAPLAMAQVANIEDARTALAEFADELVPTPLRKPVTIESPPVLVKATAVATPLATRAAHLPVVSLLDPHAPFVDVLRSILIGSLSAMLFGASFAVGFKYVSTDRPNPTPIVAIEVLPLGRSYTSLIVPHRPAVESNRPKPGTTLDEPETAPKNVFRRPHRTIADDVTQVPLTVPVHGQDSMIEG